MAHITGTTFHIRPVKQKKNLPRIMFVTIRRQEERA